MKLLVVIDSVNFHGGAHVATWLMIDALTSRGVEVEILTCAEPNADMKVRLAGVPVHVMADAFPRKGFRFLVQGICRRLKLGGVPNWTIDPGGRWRRMMKNYDTVLVIGENSHLRNLVGSVKGPRKVVFIHTDYVAWRKATAWAADDSRHDGRIYRAYDRIAVVGRPNSERFAAAFPQFANRVVPFHNIMTFACSDASRPGNEIFTLATFGRIHVGPPKSTEVALTVAGRLKAKGLRFRWRFFGDVAAQDRETLEKLIAERGLASSVAFRPFVKTPAAEMRKVDVVAHLSSYEGMSNVIYESLLAGTPVLATDVGGAREQIEDGRTGRVLELDADRIAEALAEVLRHPEIVAEWRQNLVGYKYDNDAVVDEYLEILR